jgi:hypothetical protein
MVWLHRTRHVTRKIRFPGIKTQLVVHLNAVLSPSPWGSQKLAANHFRPEDPYPAPVEALGGGRFDRRCPTDGSYPPSQKAGVRRTYEVTLLWLPPRPRDSILGLISGLTSEPASSRRGVLRYLGVVRSPGANHLSHPQSGTQINKPEAINLRGYPPERAPEEPRDRPCGGA